MQRYAIDAYVEHTPSGPSVNAGMTDCSTGDWVSYADAQAEIDRLRVENGRLLGIIDEVHSWAVCAPMATDADMMQNIGRIIEITAPNAPDQGRRQASR